MASSGWMNDDTGSSGTALRRSTRSETRETIELAVIAWACCLAVVAAIAIPLLGLAQAALIGGGALVGLVAACFAISGARLSAEESMTDRLCALQEAVGRVEACPGARCPLWEPGGTVLAGGCLIERLALDLERCPDLCHYLLELRLALDEGRADPPGTRQLFYRLSRESSPVA